MNKPFVYIVGKKKKEAHLLRRVRCRVCGKKTIAAARNSVFGLFGLIDYSLTWRSRLCLLLGLPQVVITGYVFGQGGVNDGHTGVIRVHKYNRSTGEYPPNLQSKRGDRLDPSCGTVGALSPNNVPKNKKKVYIRAWYGLRAPCQRTTIKVEAGWGTWGRLSRACFAYTPVCL